MAEEAETAAGAPRKGGEVEEEDSSSAVEEEGEEFVEFDYNVTFPKVDPTRWPPSQVRPVVFLVGWAGCKDRYLEKYSSMLNEEGCITIRCIPPFAAIFTDPDMIDRIGELLYGLFEELQLHDHPTVFYLFSGTGVLTFESFLRALETKADAAEIRGKMRGVVFDSSPARTSSYQRSLAFISHESVRRQPYWRQQVVFWSAYISFLVTKVTAWLSSFLYALPDSKRHYYDVLSEVRRLPKAQLYLYSKGDAICSHSYITAFAERQEEMEADVTRVLWEDSPHCEHYRLYPEPYRAALLDFLAKIMRDVDREDDGLQ